MESSRDYLSYLKVSSSLTGSSIVHEISNYERLLTTIIEWGYHSSQSSSGEENSCPKDLRISSFVEFVPKICLSACHIQHISCFMQLQRSAKSSTKKQMPNSTTPKHVLYAKNVKWNKRREVN